jgi:hypothetical protein
MWNSFGIMVDIGMVLFRRNSEAKREKDSPHEELPYGAAAVSHLNEMCRGRLHLVSWVPEMGGAAQITCETTLRKSQWFQRTRTNESQTTFVKGTQNNTDPNKGHVCQAQQLIVAIDDKPDNLRDIWKTCQNESWHKDLCLILVPCEMPAGRYRHKSFENLPDDVRKCIVKCDTWEQVIATVNQWASTRPDHKIQPMCAPKLVAFARGNTQNKNMMRPDRRVDRKITAQRHPTSPARPQRTWNTPATRNSLDVDHRQYPTLPTSSTASASKCDATMVARPAEQESVQDDLGHHKSNTAVKEQWANDSQSSSQESIEDADLDGVPGLAQLRPLSDFYEKVDTDEDLDGNESCKCMSDGSEEHTTQEMPEHAEQVQMRWCNQHPTTSNENQCTTVCWHMHFDHTHWPWSKCHAPSVLCAEQHLLEPCRHHRTVSTTPTPPTETQ